MTNSGSKTSLSLSDIAAGALLLSLGILAAWQAQSFDDASRSFPLYVAVLLATTGAVIVARSFLAGASRRAEYGSSARSVAAAVCAVVLWAAAFAFGAGFVVPTVALQFALLWICGLRRPASLIGAAIIVTAMAHGLFINLLDLPLPESAWPDLSRDS